MDGQIQGTTTNQAGENTGSAPALEEGKRVTDTALGIIGRAEELAVADGEEALVSREETSNPVVGGQKAAKQFDGLPIESLICAPIIAAAKGQQELTAIYVDGIKKLAYKEGDVKKGTNTMDFVLERPVQEEGKITTNKVKVQAPVLSLVPVPAFLMDELDVDFNMEVRSQTLDDSKTHDEVSGKVNYKSWFGLTASITGKVSSDREHKRTTDNTATYHISARAIQQPPSEGMAKLTGIYASVMEPIPAAKGGS